MKTSSHIGDSSVATPAHKAEANWQTQRRAAWQLENTKLDRRIRWAAVEDAIVGTVVACVVAVAVYAGLWAALGS
jgi:hypothetical protein